MEKTKKKVISFFIIKINMPINLMHVQLKVTSETCLRKVSLDWRIAITNVIPE